MKKRILGIAFMAMSLMAFNGMAQTTSNSANPSANTEQCSKDGKKCYGDKAGKDGKKADRKGGKDGKKMGAKGERPNPFEGLNLTEAQKTQLQQLDAKRKAEREKKMEAMKSQREQMKADKKNGNKEQKDMAALQAERQKKMEERNAQRVADMKDYLVQVKEIIGPDNYVQFLENVYVQGGMQKGKAMGQKSGKMGQKSGKMAHNKGQKQGRKEGNRQQKGQRQGNQKTAAVATI